MKKNNRETLYYAIINEDGKFYVSSVFVDDPFLGVFGDAFGAGGGGSVHCVFSKNLRQALVYRSRGKCEKKIVDVERATGCMCRVAGVTARDIIKQIVEEFGR